MQRYLTRRFILYFPTLVLASVIIFGLMRYLPGDIALIILSGGGGDESEAFTKEQLDNLREQLGLNDPLPIQYGKWAWSFVTWDFGGESLQTGEPIREIFARRIPVTLQLGIYTMIIAMIISLPLGVVAAIRQDTWIDYIIRSMTILGLAMPNFWVSLLVILGLVTFFSWVPPVIYENLWNAPGDHLTLVIFPALIIAWGYSSYVTRVTRSTMLEVLRQDYIRTARSKGLSERSVLWRHALGNTLIPVITVSGLYVEQVLAGSLIQENIWGIPGIGQGIVAAATTRDYPVIQSMTMLLVFMALSVNLIVDIIYAFVDPRISYD